MEPGQRRAAIKEKGSDAEELLSLTDRTGLKSSPRGSSQ
jgi:hypothetical protein